MLKIIAGIDKDYQGEVVFSPGYSVGYLEQDPKLEKGKTVKEIVQEGVQGIVDLLKEYEEVNERFGDPEVLEDPDKMDALIARQAELQDKIDATDAWNLDTKLERAMDALRCPPEDQVVDTLSGGERRRVALCRLLLQQPDVLLLDEPTNHLDAESIDWLEQHLQQYAGTVICITHDRYFLDHVAGWILELDRGEGIPWKGNYSSWLDQKTKRMAQEEKQASKRRKTLERELEWINMAPKARQAKGKARLNSYEKLLNEDQKEREAKLEIFIPNGPRLGNKVIEAHHVAKAFGDKLLFDDLNFMLPPNGIVGVIGPNGAGKTTLFKMIMGQESIDKGEFEVGETVRVGYADQTHKDIDPNKSVYQVVSGGNEFIRVGGKEINARAYLSKFNFAGADQEKLCGVLSGGERNRLHLALTLKAEANVLLLDEPTNDIDVNTLQCIAESTVKSLRIYRFFKKSDGIKIQSIVKIFSVSGYVDENKVRKSFSQLGAEFDSVLLLHFDIQNSYVKIHSAFKQFIGGGKHIFVKLRIISQRIIIQMPQNIIRAFFIIVAYCNFQNPHHRKKSTEISLR